MGARSALPLTLLLAGCPTEPVEEPFRVTFSFPAEGEEVFPETPVRVGFSDPIERPSCGPDALVLGALDDQGRVLARIPYDLVAMEDDEAYELAHDGLLPGYPHALVVQGGETGCLSAGGQPIEPFALVFEVVPRD